MIHEKFPRLLADPKSNDSTKAILQLHPPSHYVETFDDVNQAMRLSIIRDPNLHFSLYGDCQGRRALMKCSNDPKGVVIVAPSYGKKCGIGEYGRYLESVLTKMVSNVKVVRTSRELLNIDEEYLSESIVLVNHGPGLFDGFNPRLSEGESTYNLVRNLEVAKRDYGCTPIILHHSFVDEEQETLYAKQSIIENSSITSVSFIRDGSKRFFCPAVELGVSPLAVSDEESSKSRDNYQNEPDKIGFFGFFQYGGKDFESLFFLASQLQAEVIGSVATVSRDDVERFAALLDESGIDHDFQSGWLNDADLISLLSSADYFYLPQNDYDHWNNSATARFVTNLDRPVFLPPHQPFLDMRSGAIFARKADLPRIVSHFRNPVEYAQAVDRVRKFRDQCSMENTASQLLYGLTDSISKVGIDLLQDANALCFEKFLDLEDERKADFLSCLSLADSGKLEGLVESFQAFFRVPPAIQKWRLHYELSDLVHADYLESAHGIYAAICKQLPRPEDLFEIYERVHSNGETEQSPPSLDDFAVSIHETVTQALKTSSQAVFRDRGPRFFDLGEELGDCSAAQVRATAERKGEVSMLMKDVVCELDGTQPRVTNLAEVLTLPIDVLKQRSVGTALAAVDYDQFWEIETLAGRQKQLFRQSAQLSLDLSAYFVFDYLTPAPIAPSVVRYCVEDFIYFDGDAFIINAIRCLAKREAYPIEMAALSDMLYGSGKLAVLEHLLRRPSVRAQIASWDSVSSHQGEETYSAFINVARDPLFGLVDMRNEYEINVRNNERNWLRLKEQVDLLVAFARDQSARLIDVYSGLLISPSTMRTPYSGHLGDLGSYPSTNRSTSSRLADEAIVISPKRPFKISTLALSKRYSSLSGFYPVEKWGAWTNGRVGRLAIRLTGTTDDVSKFRITVRAAESESRLNRRLDVVIYGGSKGDLGELSRQFCEISCSKVETYELNWPKEASTDPAVIEFVLRPLQPGDRMQSSTDPRDLGLFLSAIDVQ